MSFARTHSRMPFSPENGHPKEASCPRCLAETGEGRGGGEVDVAESKRA